MTDKEINKNKLRSACKLYERALKARCLCKSEPSADCPRCQLLIEARGMVSLGNRKDANRPRGRIS